MEGHSNSSHHHHHHPDLPPLHITNEGGGGNKAAASGCGDRDEEERGSCSSGSSLRPVEDPADRMARGALKSPTPFDDGSDISGDLVGFTGGPRAVEIPLGEGEEEEEKKEEEEEMMEVEKPNPLALPLRAALGGSRMNCALPDHRVQVGTVG